MSSGVYTYLELAEKDGTLKDMVNELLANKDLDKEYVMEQLYEVGNDLLHRGYEVLGLQESYRERLSI